MACKILISVSVVKIFIILIDSSAVKSFTFIFFPFFFHFILSSNSSKSSRTIYLNVNVNWNHHGSKVYISIKIQFTALMYFSARISFTECLMRNFFLLIFTLRDIGTISFENISSLQKDIGIARIFLVVKNQQTKLTGFYNAVRVNYEIHIIE